MVPNAPNQVEAALAKLVLKHTDLRVWRYWRTLNLLGNFDANPDPLVRDNIMFSGFTGDQLNLYEAATGSDYFDQPGSLTFVWKDGRTFAYDHHRWMDEVRKNFDAADTTFFPCEPGWAFAACNTIGAQALLGYEVLHGRPLWSELEPRWRQTLDEEYALPDGNFANIRCTRTGLMGHRRNTRRRVPRHRFERVRRRRSGPGAAGTGAVDPRSWPQDRRAARRDPRRRVVVDAAGGVGTEPGPQDGVERVVEADRRGPTGR
jgi:hypothetical protein